MPIERGEFSAERAEKPQTKAEVEQILKNQAKESKKVNLMLRGARGTTVIAKEKRSKSTNVMNRFLRGESEPAPEFTDQELAEPTAEDLKNEHTFQTGRRKIVPEGSAGAGVDTFANMKNKPKDFNEALRTILDLRRTLGL